MPASKVQLIGGVFQDAEGNILVNGYLLMKLSQDGSVTGVGNICSGIEIRINLNASGSVDTSTPQYVWGNDQILPVNTFYKVTGYSSVGQPAWGPNNQQVIGNGGTFDVGTWVPNLVVSWVPQLQPLRLKTNGISNSSQAILDLEEGSRITLTDLGGGSIEIAAADQSINLETDGTPNASQATLNLKSGTNITLSNSGGDVTIDATSGGAVAGSNVVPLPNENTGFPGAGQGASQNTMSTSGANNTMCQMIPSQDLLCQPSSWKLSVRTVSSSTVISAEIVKCTRGTGIVISRTNITWGGLTAPTLTPAGVYMSDVMSFPIDTGFDYFVQINSSTGLFGVSQNGSAQSGSAAGVYIQASNTLGAAGPLTWVGGSPQTGKSIIIQFLAA